MHLYNFSPKIGCHGNAAFPFCTGVSQMKSTMAQVLSQNQTLHLYVAYNRSYDHFCDLLDYFGQNVVATATSLRLLQREMYSLDWSTTKTHVINNHILVVSRRNVFICIYSNFSPKIGCHGNAPLSLCRGVPQMNSPMAQTPSQNQTMHLYVAYN